ncbi:MULTISPECIES: WXG100 family type VII secretion target [Streptococcus]|uniref:ESAT-6-like protein n=2 Tax=Streptococcus TaxID=1301 RepID=A0A172Q9A0_9STRE|nr:MULTISPECIES: WXG100 family type VII secretion target [Streptococcus]AND80021.1 type VII secretion protein EsxA [Streptococcus pantholopis]AXQ79547.1 WXG100 family type VII secretion target [Streptococcus chenjunshii]RFU51462.1 WXG100 family type VII secretion target [Streptococcus chenjunshii]RFU53557.1 WXG100 family type VII secretion target [Streptococcus chenjunshii]
MVQIKLTPEELRSQATSYTNGATSVRDVLTTLTNTQADIAANWSGTSFDSFDQQFNELSPKVSQFADLLDEINQQLNQVATTIEDTDAQIASQIQQ